MFQQWATSFRSGSTVNTNMFLEAFHRVLKVVYLHHKNNRRIDFLLTTLMKIARDKAFERILKLEKGKSTHRICEINKRHSAAELIDSKKAIVQYSDNKWTVESQTQTGLEYTVLKQPNQCTCHLRCSKCRVCPHAYSCSCLDATLHATVCKHVHLVHMTQRARTVPVPDSDTQSMDFSSYFHSQPGSVHSIIGVRTTLLGKLNELQVLISNCNQIDALQSSKQHITAAITLIRALERATVPQLPAKRKMPPNSNHPVQARFFSTKKKKLSASTISKPTISQLQICRK